MKKLMPAYIISFIMSFMLCLYEPIVMYANNINDFWFDLYIILKPLFLLFLILAFFFSFIFTLIYFINKKFSSKLIIYNISVVVFFGIFIFAYIQGNFLAYHLPPLDGAAINWNDYKMDSIISVVVIIIAFIGLVFSSIKFSLKKVLDVSKYISLAILVMLLSSLVTTLLTPHVFDKKDIAVSTTRNLNLMSKKNNFIILVVDAVDSVMFDEVISKDKEFKNMFDDFTYYKDTISAYAYTRDSIPFILSGVWNENKTDFRTYYNNALDNSLLLDNLKKRKYSINIYDYELLWESKKVNEVSNLEFISRKINYIKYIKNQTKYILFKYLPYSLKKYSQVEGMDFSGSKKLDNYDLYSWLDKDFYSYIKDNTCEKTNEGVFKFLHIEGAHVPFDLNRDVNKIKSGTYYQKIEASLTIVKAYLNKLKENSVYDNSSIIVMADHGFALGNGSIGRQNPILLIKGVNEHHKMQRSTKAISFEDLNDAYMDLLNKKKSTELFRKIGEKRERRFLWYQHTKEKHMVEYIQTGKAWDEDTLKPTGKEFDL